VLLDASVDPQLATQVQGALEAGGDARIDDLHLWRLAPGKFSLMVSLHSAAPLAPSAYKARLTRFTELAHVVVEVERSP
jgi:Co/Zn/Cd efflux system component